MKCRKETGILLSSLDLRGFVRLCDHKFCQSCFRKENANTTINTNNTFSCPFCHASFYENMKSMDEAVLIGEAATLNNHIYLNYRRQRILCLQKKFLYILLKSMIWL